eukprot:TRINITY_DN6139_c0_g1_i1.p1 TRINITY_DN6139_c0_g1~~TRINITY_DN6139_c0_g1_i1.p1  ORF type:complete len:397 (-),score=100.69 TRINITY_DN6139_c0_g1_i1:108-1250(-)
MGRTSLLLLPLFVFSVLGNLCVFNGTSICENGCEWTDTLIWTDCDGKYPSSGDQALIQAEGSYNIQITQDVTVDSFIIGNQRDSDNIVLQINDGATINFAQESSITIGAEILLKSATEINGQSKLTNNGLIQSNGERVAIDVVQFDNYGDIIVSSGLLVIIKQFNHYGTLKISEMLELNGPSFIDGEIFLEVDGILNNPLTSFAQLDFGENAVYHVRVMGNSEKEYSHFDALGAVTRNGKINIKLDSKFSPSSDSKLVFFQSLSPMAGKFQTVLDLEDWTFPLCSQCRVIQDEYSVGLKCNLCENTQSDSEPNEDSSMWPFPESPNMGASYLLPGVLIVFVVLVVAIGTIELYAYLREKRRQSNTYNRMMNEEMGYIIVE